MRRKDFDNEAKNFICLRRQFSKTGAVKCTNQNKSIMTKILEKSTLFLDPRRCCNLNSMNS